MITLENIHKSFADKKVFDGVNLHINKGETLVIIGQSGVGKSVLLKHIIGLIKPDEGRILIAGQDVTPWSTRQMVTSRVRMAMLFQLAALFDSMTVAENVAFALMQRDHPSPEEVRETVRKMLDMVRLPGVEDKMPAQLSGGQKKRVGLARALAATPDIMLYDEPTTGLDPITADSINDLIVDMKKQLGITGVAVTHDMASAYKIGDRIAMLHECKIIALGTPDEIRSSRNPYVQQFIHGRAEGPIQFSNRA
jgi:phospholipid/cholesterol/gamma-HCH transport system ATP-binding protein